jgi:hypothetical protein
VCLSVRGGGGGVPTLETQPGAVPLANTAYCLLLMLTSAGSL